jgi:hypothetical protein
MKISVRIAGIQPIFQPGTSGIRSRSVLDTTLVAVMQQDNRALWIIVGNLFTLTVAVLKEGLDMFRLGATAGGKMNSTGKGILFGWMSGS